MIGIESHGQLTLEWATLSVHTKNGTYRDLVEKSVRQILSQVGMPVIWMSPRPLTHCNSQLLYPVFSSMSLSISLSRIPTIGLPAQGINPASGTSVGGYVVSQLESPPQHHILIIRLTGPRLGVEDLTAISSTSLSTRASATLPIQSLWIRGELQSTRRSRLCSRLFVLSLFSINSYISLISVLDLRIWQSCLSSRFR